MLEMMRLLLMMSTWMNRMLDPVLLLLMMRMMITI